MCHQPLKNLLPVISCKFSVTICKKTFKNAKYKIYFKKIVILVFWVEPEPPLMRRHPAPALLPHCYYADPDPGTQFTTHVNV